jgi:predicted AlkP superfamily phosphohydrolase/phosphomutase
MFSPSSPTYPATLRAEVEGQIGGAYPGELPVFRDAERNEWVAGATRAVVQRGLAAASLAERHKPDFLFALFRETDRLQHQLWTELAQPVEQIPADLRTFWRAVDTACAQVDAAFRAAGGPAVTLVISDHGHGAIRSDFFTNRWLEEQGYLVLRDPANRVSRRLFGNVSLAAQRVPPLRWASRVLADFLRDGRGADFASRVVGDASFESVSSHIDWEKTVAYSYPVPEGIYLNLRNPQVANGHRAEFLAEIRHRLETYRDAHIEVATPGQLYAGHNLAQAPSLLIRLDDMRTEPRMDFSYPHPLIRDRPQYFCGSGTHRMDGILIGAGDGVRPGADLGYVRIQDVAPTILEGMGVPGPDAWQGRSFSTRLGLGV